MSPCLCVSLNTLLCTATKIPGCIVGPDATRHIQRMAELTASSELDLASVVNVLQECGRLEHGITWQAASIEDTLHALRSVLPLELQSQRDEVSTVILQ